MARGRTRAPDGRADSDASDEPDEDADAADAADEDWLIDKIRIGRAIRLVMHHPSAELVEAYGLRERRIVQMAAGASLIEATLDCYDLPHVGDVGRQPARRSHPGLAARWRCLARAPRRAHRRGATAPRPAPETRSDAGRPAPAGRPSGRRSGAEALQEHAVAQAAVAHGQGRPAPASA